MDYEYHWAGVIEPTENPQLCFKYTCFAWICFSQNEVEFGLASSAKFLENFFNLLFDCLIYW